MGIKLSKINSVSSFVQYFARNHRSHQTRGLWYITLHLIGISFTISLCCFYDFLWRRQLNNSAFPASDQSIIKEYSKILLQLSGINIFLLIGQYAGILWGMVGSAIC